MDVHLNLDSGDAERGMDWAGSRMSAKATREMQSTLATLQKQQQIAIARNDKAFVDRLAPNIKDLTDRLAKAMAQATESIRFRTALAQKKTPAERLEYLRKSASNAPEGSAQQARANLALVQEEARQARAPRRPRTLRDRLAGLGMNELPVSVMDQALADPFASMQGPPGRVRVPRNPPPQIGETEAAARDKAAKQAERDRAKADRERAKAERNRPPTFLERIFGRRGQGGGNPLGGAFGRGAAGGLLGGFLGGAARGGVATLGSAITGNASGVIQGVLGGIQTAGTMLSALGPVGMIAGTALKVVGAAAEATAKMLDGMVETLGQYSPKTQMALANLDIATEQFKQRMSERTEGLMESWIQLKESTLELIESLTPVIEKLIAGLKLLVDVIKEITDRFAFLTNKETNADGSAKYGVGDRLKSFFGMGPMKDKYPDAGPGGLAKAGFANVNSMMMDDLGGNGAYAAQSRAAASGGGPLGVAGVVPAPRAPGGQGIGLNVYQSNEFKVEDMAAVDRATEQVRVRLFDALGQCFDRVEFLAGMCDARNAVELAL